MYVIELGDGPRHSTGPGATAPASPSIVTPLNWTVSTSNQTTGMLSIKTNLYGVLLLKGHKQSKHLTLNTQLT